jgi:hypothetical protein
MNRLSCKSVRCQFKQRSVTYLRMIIGQGQTAINPKKAAAIAEWPTPTSLKEVHRSWARAISGRSLFEGSQ